MSDPDPLGWNTIARRAQASGDPNFATWIDPDDPMGWNQAARTAKKNGDPNYANWTDPLGDVPAYATTDTTTPNLTPGVTAVTTPAPPAAKPDDSAWGGIAQYLGNLGLDSLFQVDAQGNPGGWLWDQIANGNDTEAGLRAAVEATPAFQARYPIIQQLRNAGVSFVPSPAMVREFEAVVGQTFRNAGLPPEMYNDPMYLQGLMDDYGGAFGSNGGTSAAEIAERVGSAYERVRSTSPQIRQAFEQYYGAGGGDAALAAFFLDPQKSMADLGKKSMAAYAGGTAQQLGVSMDQATAERLGATPKTEAGIYQDLTQVAQLGNVYNEGITETQDLTQQTGIEATSFGNADAASALERRVLERQTNARSSFGGGLLNEKGLTGVG